MGVSQPIYSARNLVREYVMGGRVLRVVDNVTLDIMPGEVLAILGPSGAGKSTLLHILGLLDRPSRGSLHFQGKDLAQLSRRDFNRMRNEVFGFIFQFYHLLPEFSALHNVMMPAMIKSSVRGWPARKREANERAAELLEQVGLGQRMTHRPSELSGGERQRVAIARALMNSPAVVFCDEPTGNLDRGTAEKVEKQLWNLARSLDQAFVIVTHDERLAQKADRVMTMLDGKLRFAPPEALAGDPWGLQPADVPRADNVEEDPEDL